MASKNTPITDWIRPEEAKDYINKAISKGEYKKGQIKQSSRKFKNGKDKTDGYLVRVMLVADAVIEEQSSEGKVEEPKTENGLKPIEPVTDAKFDAMDKLTRARLDSMDQFSLEDEKGDVEMCIEHQSKMGLKKPVQNLMLELAYIEARLAMIEKTMDPAAVAAIRRLEKSKKSA